MVLSSTEAAAPASLNHSLFPYEIVSSSPVVTVAKTHFEIY